MCAVSAVETQKVNTLCIADPIDRPMMSLMRHKNSVINKNTNKSFGRLLNEKEFFLFDINVCLSHVSKQSLYGNQNSWDVFRYQRGCELENALSSTAIV